MNLLQQPSVSSVSSETRQTMPPVSPHKSYILKSPKAIEFYNKNPHIDFNLVNELFIDTIQKVTTSAQSTIGVSEVRSLLNGIHSKVSNLENEYATQSQWMKMSYDLLGSHKNFYVESMKQVLQQSNETTKSLLDASGNELTSQSMNKDQQILSLIRETNQNLIDKTIHSVLQQFPKLSDLMSTEMKYMMQVQQNEIIQETQKTFLESFKRQDNMALEETIHKNYQTISTKIQDILYSLLQKQDTKLTETQQLFQGIGKDFQSFLEKQKNSTLKGKESEEKLESCLVSAFPNAEIICQSGQAQCCDYRLVRADKPDVLFENKDYTSNVPHDEIKKFVRDIEYQNKHGILLSQNSGITQKQDYQIDIHAGKILVYVHFAKYDENKLRVAVNLIDHLHPILENYETTGEGNVKSAIISMDELSEINKEYLNFIGQKKSLIEVTKKMQKEQLKAIEDFAMPKLTEFLNSKFTNVEQLSYKCEYCGIYSAKNKRALVSHQNRCKTKLMKFDDGPVGKGTDVTMTSSSTTTPSQPTTETDEEDMNYIKEHIDDYI